MKHWRNLASGHPERHGLLMVSLSALVAVALGFVVTPPDVGGRLIIHWGYYYILIVFALWLFFLWRVVRPNQTDWRAVIISST